MAQVVAICVHYWKVMFPNGSSKLPATCMSCGKKRIFPAIPLRIKGWFNKEVLYENPLDRPT